MDYQIKRFKKEDLLEVLKVESKVFGTKAYGIDVFLNLIKDSNIFYIAKWGNKIVGYILAGSFKSKIKIISIGVLKKYQGRGIGSSLLKKVIEESKEKKMDLIELEVRETRKDAIEFYKKFGFEKKTVLDNYYSDNENAYQMVKKNG